jgi:DNA polymerase IV (DinB-like DNA polymerase)
MTKLEQKIILHLDMDSYLRVRRNAKNQNLWENRSLSARARKGARDGEISLPARMMHGRLASGLPCQFRRQSPSVPYAIFLPSNFPLYARASGSVMEILRSFNSRFEQVSIDEAFLDLSLLGNYSSV